MRRDNKSRVSKEGAMKEYVEEYRGFTIRRMGDALNIYDKNGCYVKRVETLIVRAAEIKIDEIINRNRLKFPF